ncbi:MAG: TatD family hydrolase [Egicoccus sp.]
MPYVDTHCHLDHHEDLTPTEQVERARAAGVETMITVGTDMASSTQALRTAARFEGVWAAVGVHPNDAMEATPHVLEVIDRLAQDDNVVAVGETGLDYYRDYTTPAQQEAAFRAHIQIARQHDRALVIHCRDAWEDCLDILVDEGAPERVVMHCFSGDLETTKRCAEAGWYLSFAGNVTFGNAGDLREAAAAAPLELLLTETDSPFLTPHPHRGKPNDPSYVPYTLRTLAEVQGRPVDEVEAAVETNTRRAFALPTE